jgi:hypothetical protein
MKKISSTFLLIFCFSIINISCSNDKETKIGELINWPEGTSVYAPYTIGSTFKYEVSIVNPTAGQPPIIDFFTYTVTKDTLIDGLKFKKLDSNNKPIAGNYYCHYDQITGERTEINLNANFAGVAIAKLKENTIRVKEEVNATWNGGFTGFLPSVTSPINGTINYKILKRDFVKNVLSKDYYGSFEIEQVFSLTIPGIGDQAVQVNNFYAKNAGVIQRDFPSDGSFGIYNYKLKESNIIKN